MNYNKLMESIIEEIKTEGKTPSVLLHSCCAPCSSHVIDLLTNYFDITILYYNPNIEPYEEYLKRKEEEIRFIEEYPNKNKLTIMDCDHDNEVYHDTIRGLEGEPEGGARCSKCYYLRLDKTAQLASENNFDYFATTLTVSPLKNSEKLNSIGEHLSKIYNIKYLYSDFKKKEGYKHSISLAKEYNLYRQDYCGCIYSNAKVVANSFGEIKVDKEPSARTKRIDPVDAVIDAHVTYMKFKEDIDVEAEMTNYLQAMGWHEE